MTSGMRILPAMVTALLLASSLLIGCGGAAPPAPTSAPQPAAKAAEPAQAAAPAPTKAAAQAPAPTKAAAQAPARAEGFFKGKSITIILPNRAGGGNDGVVRYVVPFLKEASGAKEIRVDNQPGAGGTLGLSQVYTAKPDGLTWGAGEPAVIMLGQLSGQEGASWDANKFNYIGRIFYTPRFIITPAKGGVRTVDDALKLGRPINMPISGVDEDYMGLALVTHFTGIQTRIISGYEGETDIFLALLRGEGDWVGASVETAEPMIKDGDMAPVLAFGVAERLKDYPDVPTAVEIMKDPAARNSMTAVNNMISLLMSFTLPPGTDPKIVAEARYIWDQVAKNPDVAAGMPAKTGGRTLEYMSGEELQAKVAQTMAESSALVPVLKAATESVK